MIQNRPYKEIAEKDQGLDSIDIREAARIIYEGVDWWTMPAVSNWSNVYHALIDLANEIELQAREKTEEQS